MAGHHDTNKPHQVYSSSWHAIAFDTTAGSNLLTVVFNIADSMATGGAINPHI